MKYCIIILAFLFSATLAYSQEQESDEIVFEDNELKKREVKINLVGVQWGYTSLAYEQLFYKYNFALGAEIGTNFVDVLNTNFDYTILPYARVYFGKSHNGFFLEVNYALAQFEEVGFFDNFMGFLEMNSKIRGPGASLGLKYLSDNGLFGEIVLGVGRNTVPIESNSNEDVFLRVGIMIGKRLW